MILFRCVRCDKVLTRPLQELESFSSLSVEEKTDYISEGFFAYGRDIVKKNKTPYIGMGALSESDVVFNLKDLRNTQHIKNRGSGCCGYDGQEINIQCSNCRKEIGAENSDCFMPHFIRVPLENVKIDLTQHKRK
jgi:hypothetical protein